MRESHVEGVATHDDPESCAGTREGEGEALTGARAGRVLSREMHLQDADVVMQTEGNIDNVAIARRGRVLRGRRPRARTEPLCARTGRSAGRSERSALRAASEQP